MQFTRRSKVEANIQGKAKLSAETRERIAHHLGKIFRAERDGSGLKQVKVQLSHPMLHRFTILTNTCVIICDCCDYARLQGDRAEEPPSVRLDSRGVIHTARARLNTTLPPVGTLYMHACDARPTL